MSFLGRTAARSVRHLLVALLCGFGAFLAFQFLAPLRGYEAASQDDRFRLRGVHAADPRVVIVGLDEQTLQQTNGEADRPRLRHARLVDRLSAAGAAVIGFDMLFDRPSAHPEDDARFATAIRSSGRVVLPMYQRAARSLGGDLGDAPSGDQGAYLDPDAVHWLESHGRSLPGEATEVPLNAYTWGLPIPSLRDAAASLGYIHLPASADGIYRTIRFYSKDNQDHGWPALSTAIFTLFAHSSNGSDRDHTLLERLEQSGDSLTYLDFPNPPASIPHLSYSDVLDDPTFRPELVRGKIVLIGETHGTADEKPTPLSPIAKGVEFHATAINGLLTDRFLHPIGRGQELVIDLMMALLAALLMRFFPTGIAVACGIGLVALYLGGSQGLFLQSGLTLPVLGPTAAAIAAAWLTLNDRLNDSEAARRKVESFWRSYVGPDVMQEILENPALADPHGYRIEATIVFSDIRGYSSLSEKLPPEQVFRQINEHFDEMSRDIFANGGAILGVTGDGLLMVFGWPKAHPDHADRAVSTAKAIVQRLAPLNERWRSEGRPTIDIGLGLHTGTVIAGQVGSEEGSALTVIGDAVNVASRVQDLNKQLQTRILITDAVRQKLTLPVALGKSEPVMLRGRAEGITVYELLTDVPASSTVSR